MSPDVLACFSCLDELTQVVYQGVHRFVVLSSVSDVWTIHVGLAGPEGRWWRGNWKERDILNIVGSKSSDKLLEAFAEKLADTFVQGELYIGDWNVAKGAEIKLTLGPSSKKPLDMPLVEMSSSEAAAYATSVFLEIALQAQSRRCRLHPPEYPTSSVAVLDPFRNSGSSTSHQSNLPRTDPSRYLVTGVVRPSASHATLELPSTTSTDKQTQDEIKALKTELDKQKRRMVSPPETNKNGPRPLKGASLANPNKKARKYQAIEFESDEE